jgi:hypothetical protein
MMAIQESKGGDTEANSAYRRQRSRTLPVEGGVTEYVRGFMDNPAKAC